MFKKFCNNQAGMSILEILIGATIITVGILALVNTYSIYVKYALTHDKTIQAAFLLEEGIEAMNLIRDTDWDGVIATWPTATTSLYFSGTAWELSSTTDENIGAFVRNVKVGEVYRDPNGIISASGTADPDTKFVTVYVSYPQSTGTTTKEISKYLVNLYDN